MKIKYQADDEKLFDSAEECELYEDAQHKCPDCGGAVKYYHCKEGSRVVCKSKCKGWKVIFSRGKFDNEYQDGDVL